MSSTLSEDGPVVAQPGTRGRHAAVRPKRRLRALGSIARSITVPAPAPVSRRSEERRTGPAPDRATGLLPAFDTVDVPVLAGDTVSDVAARYGVSTASLLALNGLSWRSGISAGDVLRVRATTAAPATEPAPARRHRVRAGEGTAAIAARYRIGEAALLLANGLSRGIDLRPGTELVVPSPHGPAAGEGVALTGDPLTHAQLVADVAGSLRVPLDGLVIALVAAMQDSSLLNLDFGEEDRIGLFQQRIGGGWGSPAALLDPRRATLAFFRGGEDGAVGLLGTPGWDLMGVGEAAHAVQRLSTPAAYARWERAARGWATELTRP